MCGRYSQTNLLDALKERFSFDSVESDYPVRYNIAPGQIAPVIVSHRPKSPAITATEIKKRITRFDMLDDKIDFRL